MIRLSTLVNFDDWIAVAGVGPGAAALADRFRAAARRDAERNETCDRSHYGHMRVSVF